MMEQLKNIGGELRAVLDRYLSICSNIRDLCSQENVHEVPDEYLRDIKTELAHFPSYEPKLRKAEASISQVRNHMTKLTPIAALPPEILTHIFHFVTNPCGLVPLAEDEYSEVGTPSTVPSEDSHAASNSHSHSHGGLSIEDFPAHLECLTHVCSHWRQVAITSSSLWTHIDLLPHRTVHRGFLARAKAHLVRASQLPVELHIADSSPVVYNRAALRKFLTSITKRIKSLDVAVVHKYRNFHEFVLAAIFSHRSPKCAILTKLTTSFVDEEGEEDEFISDSGPKNQRFFHLAILHLRGLYPSWESTAYHNLVDLRLVAACNEYWTQISELKLRTILEVSPGLRIFHFALEITDQQEDNEAVAPVLLKDLEALSISTDRDNYATVLEPGHILRLIAPGSKPFHLSIWHWQSPSDDDSSEHNFSQHELLRFFQRSNIIKFRAKSACPQLDSLLRYTSNPVDLVLDSCVSGGRGTKLFQEFSPVAPLDRLNSLVLHDCSPNLAQIELLLQHYPTNLIILSQCDWRYIDNSSQHPVDQVQQLLERYPASKSTILLSNPTAGWNFID